MQAQKSEIKIKEQLKVFNVSIFNSRTISSGIYFGVSRTRVHDWKFRL